jgi:hypothetical protein
VAFDNSRYTFNPFHDYSGVVMEQGRVQLDSDWNEWLAELSRRIQAGTLDIMGRAAYPATTPFAFQITASTSASGNNTIAIGPGRMYVDGLLAENHGPLASAQWDPALAELSGSPQPPPATDTDTVDYASQPYLPGVPLNASGAATALAGDGPFFAYLDVWTRPVTFLQDPTLVDAAVGVDTTGRLQTVWQVRILPAASGAGCSDLPWPASSAGQLTTGTVTLGPSGPCCLTTGAGYTGLENQLYRVEIHQPGTPVAGPADPTPYPLPAGSTTATFKWSRDNASVATGVTAITAGKTLAGNSTSQLSVVSMGRDQVLGFAPGNWIELTDDFQDLNGEPGELHLVDNIDFAGRTITLATPASSADFPVDGTGQLTASRNTRIRRWDQSGKVYLSDNSTVWVDLGANDSTGDIPVPPAGTTLILEDGITVTFGVSTSGGAFNTADYWTFSARTADGLIDILTAAPARGIHHHYTPLSIVTFDPPAATDCRTGWPPASADDCGCCCTATVGMPGSGARYTSINKAIKSLGAAGGEVCILPGLYYEHVHIVDRHDIVIKGCGWQTILLSPSLKPEDNQPASSQPGVNSVDIQTDTTPATNLQVHGDTVGAPEDTDDDTSADTGNTAASKDTHADAFSNSGIGFKAVITIEASQHIQLRCFVVIASRKEVGILIDGDASQAVYTVGAGASETNSENTTAPGATDQNTTASGITDQDTTDQDSSAIAAREAADADDSARNPYLAGGVIDITIEDLIVYAATRPAIFARDVQLLRIDRNRILMDNVVSLWPAVYISGTEIHFDRNYVSALTAAVRREWLPLTIAREIVLAARSDDASTGSAPAPSTGSSTAPSTGSSTDPSSGSGSSSSSTDSTGESGAFLANDAVIHPGGIQIGGNSTDVYIIDNEIENGARNGITLGSLLALDANGDPITVVIGLLTSPEGACSTTGSLQVPVTLPGYQGSTIVSGGILTNIRIQRNRIRSMGLCGIGPVGFFNLLESLEIVTIDGLDITGNEISSTLKRDVDTPSGGSFLNVSALGYGAVTVPDVFDLLVRDNLIDTFGDQPGSIASGIFILNGEMVEISRNQIFDLRDLSPAAAFMPPATGGGAGILAFFVTPPSLAELTAGVAAASGDAPGLSGFKNGLSFEPALPALRIQNNVVRLPASPALMALGIGPYSIVDNHFSTGGNLTGVPTGPQTVMIMNFGSAIETITLPSAVAGLAGSPAAGGNASFGTSGAVLFANNLCQLEAGADAQTGSCSVAIFAADHLNFANNHCWLQAAALNAAIDVLLYAGSLTVTGNRLQESVGAVTVSGFAFGSFTIASNNISTYCLLALGTIAESVTGNLVTLAGTNQEVCADLLNKLSSTFGA